MGKHHCSNSDVKIVTVTEDLIEAVCDKCGKAGRAERKNHFEFEWQLLVNDALTKHAHTNKTNVEEQDND